MTEIDALEARIRGGDGNRDPNRNEVNKATGGAVRSGRRGTARADGTGPLATRKRPGADTIRSRAPRPHASPREAGKRGRRSGHPIFITSDVSLCFSFFY